MVFLAAGFLAMGFLGAPAVIEMAHNISNPPPVQPSPTPIATPPATVDPTANPSDVQTDIPQKSYVYAVLEQTYLTGRQTMEAQIISLKNKGADNVVVTLKDPQGLIWFDTATDIGSQAKAETPVDVRALRQFCDDNDMRLTVQLYTFMDRTAPTVDREVAVKYKGTDMNWLDSSKELGGKPWANPASQKMQEYMYALVKELCDMGVEDFIFSAVQLPTGYSLEMRDFGADNTQLQAQLQGFINTMHSKVAAGGGQAYFAFDVAALCGVNVEKYIITPQRYGVGNIVIVGSGEELDRYYEQAMSALKNSENVERIVLWNTDGNTAGNQSAQNGYFIK